MPLSRPLPCPPGHSPLEWAALLRTSPGEAAARWLAAHEDVVLEEEGPNRGELLRRWLPYPAAVDGLPYCARLLLAVLDAAGAKRVEPKGVHWFWHNGRVATWEDGHEEAGTWRSRYAEPRPGWLVFQRRRGPSDVGKGGHVDIVLSFDGDDGMLEVVGANVADTIKRRYLHADDDVISGYGIVRRAAA